MKKLILLCLLFIFSGTFYAQDTQSKKAPIKKETTKKKSGYDYDKETPTKSTKKETSSKTTKKEETAKKETTKKKSGYNYDKEVSVKSAKKEASSKSASVKETAIKETSKSKSGYDSNIKSNTTEEKKVDAKIKDKKYTTGNTKQKATYVESNEKAPKKPDRVTGEYNGKKVYTGSRGGKYYINKNGNKTYIQD